MEPTQFVFISPAVALMVMMLMLPMSIMWWYWQERALIWLLAAFGLSAAMHLLAGVTVDMPWPGTNLAAMVLPPLFVACYCASAISLMAVPDKVQRLPSLMAAVLLGWFTVSFYNGWSVAGRAAAVTLCFLATGTYALIHSRRERGVGLSLLPLCLIAFPATAAALLLLKPHGDWRLFLIVAPYILVGMSVMSICAMRAIRDMRSLQAKVFNLELGQGLGATPNAALAEEALELAVRSVPSAAPLESSAGGQEALDAVRQDLLAQELGELNHPVEVGPTSLLKATERALAALSRDLPSHFEAVPVRIGPLPHVLANPARLQQVMYRLLANALQHSFGKPGASILVGSLNDRSQDRGDGMSLCFVQDHGHGFDPQDAEELFTPVGQLSTGGRVGRAFGVVFVQRVVESLGGKVWAEGEPGAGATFFFTLPAVETREA